MDAAEDPAQPGKVVLVCGGRSFNNDRAAYRFLDMLHAIHRFSMVIHGAAIGADTIADNWCYARHVDVTKYPANWKRDKRAAGPMRNQQMLDEGKPTLVIAFPGGRGTANMVRKARAAGVDVIDLDNEATRRAVSAQWQAIRTPSSLPTG